MGKGRLTPNKELVSLGLVCFFREDSWDLGLSPIEASAPLWSYHLEDRGLRAALDPAEAKWSQRSSRRRWGKARTTSGEAVWGVLSFSLSVSVSGL